MSDRHLLPDSGSNGAPNGATDPGPKRQQSNDGGHVLVRDGSLGCYTGANHTECTTKGNEDLCPNERDITVQNLVDSPKHSRGAVSYVAFLPQA